MSAHQIQRKGSYGDRDLDGKRRPGGVAREVDFHAELGLRPFARDQQVIRDLHLVADTDIPGAGIVHLDGIWRAEKYVLGWSDPSLSHLAPGKIDERNGVAGARGKVEIAFPATGRKNGRPMSGPFMLVE